MHSFDQKNNDLIFSDMRNQASAIRAYSGNRFCKLNQLNSPSFQTDADGRTGINTFDNGGL